MSEVAASSEPHHGVHEVWGPTLPPLQAAAAIAMGVDALIVAGVSPVILGALADAHRISAPQIGLTAMAEVVAMGVATGAMGLAGTPRRLRWIGALTAMALALTDVACLGASGVGLIGLRVAAGAFEGVLLWITIGMIARTTTPERWAAVFFTVQTAVQALMALGLSAAVLPRFGGGGGYAALGVVALAASAAAWALPPRYAPLPRTEGQSGAPSLRGWIALAATAPLVAGGGAVGIYLQPLAHQAGLGAEVVRTAVWTSLVAQMGGGLLATALAGRIGYMTVMAACGVASLAAFMVLGLHIPAWLFIADNLALGATAMLIAAFIPPMTIAADPTRRAALQTGAAQLLGGAMGPLLASFIVSDQDARGTIALACGLMILGLIPIAGLRLTERARRASPISRAGTFSESPPLPRD